MKSVHTQDFIAAAPCAGILALLTPATTTRAQSIETSFGSIGLFELVDPIYGSIRRLWVEIVHRRALS